MRYKQWRDWFQEILAKIRISVVCKNVLLSWYDEIMQDEIAIGSMKKFLCFLDLVMEKNREYFLMSSENVYVKDDERKAFIVALMIHSKKLLNLFVKLNLPVDIFYSTIEELPRKMEIAISNNVELESVNLDWLMRIFTFNVIQVGRLQFGFGLLSDPLYILQNLESGEIRLFLKDQFFDEQGDVTSRQDKQFQKSEFIETLSMFRGNNITKEGRLKVEKTVLSKTKWRIVVSSGEQIVEVHIPTGTKLNVDECIEAFERFEKICQEILYKGKCFICRSWLMGCSIRKCLCSSSNIVRFQDLFVLYPSYRGEEEIWKRVFNLQTKPDEKFSPISSLQKNLCEGYKRGEIFGGGGGVKLFQSYVIKSL